MSQVRPRRGFHLAWRGELDADEVNASVATRRHLEPTLDALDEIESSLDPPALPRVPDYTPITPDLLDRVTSGLRNL